MIYQSLISAEERGIIGAFSNNEESLEMKFKAWSHSRITTFQQCKFRAKLAYIDRIPEPERPLPPGKTEHANERGERLHIGAEAYIRGGVELVPELSAHFEGEFKRARELFKQGKLSLEGEWAFTKEWECTAWKSSDAWCRIKADLVAFMTDDYAVVVDYKSGKSYGNELKHTEQLRLYAIAVLLKYPNVKKVRTEAWYLDQDELLSMDYTRAQALRFLKNFEDRGVEMTECEEFPANPNQYSCRWCPYKPEHLGGTGHCEVGV